MTQSRKRRFAISNTFLILILIGIYCLWSLGRPLAAIDPIKSNLDLQSTSARGELNWPVKGQAAVGINPSGVLATHGEQTPVPTASVAKVFTALIVLKKRPMVLNQTGPTITMTEADVDIYREYVAGDGTVTPIEVGTKLTQYQMLQAILLPSANNISDTLAIWAFGSLEEYSKFANNYIRQLGLTNTVIGTDASGYSSTTVSTARDLVLLGEAAMQEPVIAEIVSQPSAVLPEVGTINNRNFLLGPNGLAGIKTGTTEEAGGVFLAAKKVNVEGKPITIVSAIAGADTSYDAVVDSVPLLKSVEDNFAKTVVLPAKSVVGRYKSPWGTSAAAVTTTPLTAVAWKGSTVPSTINLVPISSKARSGEKAGIVRIPQSSVSTANSVPVELDGSFGQPSLLWRLTHPF